MKAATPLHRTLLPTLAVLSAVTLTAAAPSHGGRRAGRDDCAPGTRHARAEYAAEHRHSRLLKDLDCAGLTAYAEASRLAANAQYHAVYHRLPLAPPARRVPAAPAPSIPTETLPTEPSEPSDPPPPPAPAPAR